MRAVAALFLAALATAAFAYDTPSVTISALRDPVDKSYRRMVKGMELFTRMHDLAPEASLRFRLLPRKRDTDMSDIAVSVVGDSFERALPVAADGTFTIMRDARAFREAASVRPNRKSGTLTWRVDIRTPGLAPDTRRLGDLRLECRVGMEAGLVSHYPSLLERIVDAVLGGGSFCEAAHPTYLFFADRPLFAVTLISGERRETLSIGELYAGIAHGRAPMEELRYCDCEALLDRAYYVPLGDRSWPDDTRVALQYMEGASDAATDYPALIGDTKADVESVFGEGKALRWGSGFEIWAYQFGPPERRLGQEELVVLFGPEGAVTKARLRPAP